MNAHGLVGYLLGVVGGWAEESTNPNTEPVTLANLVELLEGAARLAAADNEREARAQEVRDRLSVVPGVAPGATEERNRVGECHGCGGPLLEWFEWTPGDHPGERDYLCPACGKRTRFYSAAWLDTA